MPVAVTVRVPLPVPEAGLTVSHVALSVAVQERVPPPVLLMLSVWVAGLLPPCWAVKDKLSGLAPMAGGTGAAVTVKDTGTETEVAPGALRVIIPLCVPAVRVPVVTVRVTELLPVPDTCDSINHGALLVADQVRVPPPVLLMLSVWVAGLLPA